MRDLIIRALATGPCSLPDLYERILDANTNLHGAEAAVAIARAVSAASREGLIELTYERVSLKSSESGHRRRNDRVSHLLYR